MFEALGYEVKRLDRVQYAGLTTDGLRRGGWRYLSKPEERMLRKFAGIKEQ
jgi:16S rRNA U516 pseudouridylate synthase RsuA-like enzyme